MNTGGNRAENRNQIKAGDRAKNELCSREEEDERRELGVMKSCGRGERGKTATCPSLGEFFETQENGQRCSNAWVFPPTQRKRRSKEC